MSRPPTDTEVDPISVETAAVAAPPARRADAMEYPDDRGLAPPRQNHPYRPDRERERIRGWLALGLAGMLAAVLLISWREFALGRPVDQIADMFQATLAPLIGLVGAATGFYFGDRR